MSRVQMLVGTVLLFAAAAFPQASSSDSQITQALLAEIRQLRQDVRVSVVTIQRAQILMYRLQVETGLLTRATQRLDEARKRCDQTQSQMRGLTAAIEQQEARKSAAVSPVEQKNAEEALARLKAALATWTTQEQECRTGEIEAESQSRSAQARVNDLQEQLDKLDKYLADLAAR